MWQFLVYCTLPIKTAGVPREAGSDYLFRSPEFRPWKGLCYNSLVFCICSCSICGLLFWSRVCLLFCSRVCLLFCSRVCLYWLTIFCYHVLVPSTIQSSMLNLFLPSEIDIVINNFQNCTYVYSEYLFQPNLIGGKCLPFFEILTNTWIYIVCQIWITEIVA